MKKIILGVFLAFSFQMSMASVNACLGNSTDEMLCETLEIQYETGEAIALKNKASALGSAASIYEYLRNNTNYAIYHGARSSSVNTFLALEGNDVDLASTLIALYRSVGIKSRYVVGDIRLSRADISNWLSIENEELAVSVLQNQGINIVDSTDSKYVTFEHVWIEALIDFSNYRGGSDSIANCVAESDHCKWVALDPSFKLKAYQSEHKKLLEEHSFDYDAYYRAETNQALRDKSPLEIFEESSLAYLRDSNPGVSLEDVIDRGEIIKEDLGLLPSSLPYEVIGNAQRFNSIEEHDLSESITSNWNKQVVVIIHPVIGGAECTSITMGGTYSAVELSTKQLTVNWGLVNGSTRLAMRLDGEPRGTQISANFTIGCNGATETISQASRFNITLSLEASPNANPIEVKYENLMVGGYYLIATGGETSNWSQVKRAYEKLLSANTQYPLLNNEQNIVYVDVNGSGVVDAGDTQLLDNQEAQDALTGGLLYTAQALYYTRLKEESRRYSRMKNIISPIAAFAGIVSTTYEVELVDDTPFSVLPGGLLIDLKGIRINGSWEADKPESYSNETFKFLGHAASSLEHEIWQELTGYDAVSTMRGIQFALKDEAELMNIHNTPEENTFESSLLQMGLKHSAPAEFVKREYDIFTHKMVSWEYQGSKPDTAGFYFFKSDLTGLDSTDYQAYRYEYSANNGVDDTFSNFDEIETTLKNMKESESSTLRTLGLTISGATGLTVAGTPTLSGSDASKFKFVSHSKPSEDVIKFVIQEKTHNPSGSYNVAVDFLFTANGGVGSHSAAYTFTLSDQTVSISCNGSNYNNITIAAAISQWESCFEAIINNGQEMMQFIDRNLGFDPDQVFYKNKTLALTDYGIDFVSGVRDSMYWANEGYRFNYTAPSKLTSGPFFLFEVYIKDAIETSTENIVSSSYIIRNQSMRLSAGGGYVPEGVPVIPATDTEGLEGDASNLDATGVTFNNEVFTDKNLVAIGNNDIIRTPSTVDPVSTVTGNMYHDETDVIIPGKGLAYTFTRTYNSNETTTDGVGSSNTQYLPLSQGWTHSYNMKLVSNDYGQYPNYDSTLAPENSNNKTSSITFVDERGGESNYLIDDATTSSQPSSPRAGFDNLLLDTPSAGLHTIKYSNGVSYTFDSQGVDMRAPGTVARLYKIEDAYGNQLNFAYSNNQLTRITDGLSITGRTGLTLDYHTTGENIGRLHHVTDWTNRQWEYLYTNGKLASVKNPLGDSMAYTYVEGTHWLKDIIHPQDRNGKQKTMTFGYYENGQAYNYVDQNASEESLIYDLYRRRTRVTNPNGNITEHYYDQNGALTKLVEPDKGILLFENNTDGLRFTKYNALGQRTRYSYDSSRDLTGQIASNTNGQVTREEDALGKSVDYTYGLYDQVTTVKDKNGNQFTNHYYAATDAATGAVKGKLQKSVAAKATVNGVLHTNVTLAEYQYHADGTLKKQISYIDPAQPSKKHIIQYSYVYNADGSYQVITTITGSGKTITTEQHYDNLWRLTASTVKRQASSTDTALIDLTTSYVYDDLGRVIKTTDPMGNVAETTFDKNGKLSQSIARYKLLASGNSPLKSECFIDEENYPNHHSCILQTNVYDAADRLTTSTDIMGATTRYQYDAMGNVLKVTNAKNSSLRYEYDAKGHKTKVTNENNYSIKTEYDLAGRVIKIIDANNNSIKYTYDGLGRQLTTTTPEGRQTRFDEYDANGNTLRMTDANGVTGLQPKNIYNATVHSEFDEFNRLVVSLNANNEKTKFSHDLLGNRTSVTDARNQVTKFVYDDLGRLTNVIDPIVEAGTDKVVSMSYDQLGNRLAYTDRLGESTRYNYDLLNRLVKEEYLTDSINAEKSYDQYGDMVSTSYGDSIYSYAFDAAHRLTRKTDNRNNLSMTWQYDIIGNAVRKTNFENQVQKYVYDSTNRLVSMSVGEPVTLQASYHYDPAGRLLSRILSNGSSTLYTYSADGFLLTMKQVAADGSIIDLREYQQDHVGNIRQLVINGSETINYTYDPAYRLTNADSTINSHDIAYTYDAVGNRMSKTANSTVHHYTYETGNQLDSVQSSTGSPIYRFAYDANGSLLKKYGSDGELILDIQYDQRRLASVMNVTKPAANEMSFEYDANAYRIEKQDSNGAKKYFLEGEHLESVYNESDELQANYLRGAVIDEVITGFEKNEQGIMESRTFHHDQVNSVVALTDHNGSTAQSIAYGPFGESLANTGSSQNAMQYTGREQDNETGLHYYRARYYDAELGRFISEDPIGFEGGINFYAYVGNKPLIANDPMGTRAAVYVYSSPNFDQGFEYIAYDDQGSSTLFGSFNSATWVNTQTIEPGPYDVNPRPFIETNLLQGIKDLITFDDRNSNVGIPTLSNTSNWNTIENADGSLLYGVQIHPGRTADGGGVSEGCLVCSDADFGRLNQLFENNYDNGGVSLQLFPDDLNYSPIPGSLSNEMNYSPVSSSFDNVFGGSNGGFVLYPNKVNSNMSQAVYRK